MQRDYMLLDVFTDQLFGGNQLAVFLEGEGLTTVQMQAVAAELNLSETSFLGARDDSDESRPLRIFTPKVELPFAGHPTIGSALAMAQAGMIQPENDAASLTFSELAGPVDVRVDWQDGNPVRATLSIEAVPAKGPTPKSAEIARVLGLEDEDIGDGGLAAEAAARSMGVPFTLVPVRNETALARATLDLAQWRAVFADGWAPHLYVFTTDTTDPAPTDSRLDIRARMFAPSMGISEDPATGAAAAALAALLSETDATLGSPRPWVIGQGIEMGRPSRLHIAARRHSDGMVSVDVGGSAVLVGEGRLRIA